MATKEKKEIRLEKVLQDMSHSLNHIEDIMADDRELLVKLVKQNNSIVDFLKQIQIDEVTADYEYEDILNDYDILLYENFIEKQLSKNNRDLSFCNECNII